MGNDERDDEILGRNLVLTQAPRTSCHFFSFPKSMTQCVIRSLLGRQLKWCFERQCVKIVQTSVGAFSDRVYFVSIASKLQTMSHQAKRRVAAKDLNYQLVYQPK